MSVDVRAFARAAEKRARMRTVWIKHDCFHCDGDRPDCEWCEGAGWVAVMVSDKQAENHERVPAPKRTGAR